MRCVSHGYCSFESLCDGSVDLAGVARMNEAIDVDNENRMRISEWAATNG